MRAVSLIALFLVSLLRLSAQAVAPQPSDPPVSPEDAAFDKIYPHRTAPMVEGRILHLAPEECRRLTISYTLVTPFASFQSKRTCTLADDGSFILKTDYALPRQQIWLQVGDLYYGGLYVDTQLRIVLDAQKLKAANGISFFGDGVSFEGADGPLNAYLSKYLTLRSPEQRVVPPGQ